MIKENINSEDIKLFVVTHKDVSSIPKERTLISVGSNHVESATVADSEGDNISCKNSNYCELTALYWMWKNDSSKIIGLEHYRRFFCKNKKFSVIPLQISDVKKLLSKYDLIVPQKYILDAKVYSDYSKHHFAGDLDLCLAIINEKYPDYADAIQKVMETNQVCAFNMFIMDRVLLEDYCTWLFDILFELEKRINIDDYDDYQKRIFGFLSERLFNIWLVYKNPKCFYAEVYNYGDNPIKKKLARTKTKIKYFFKR